MRRHTERGQATVEMVVVLMLLILLVFGAFEFAQGMMLKHALDVGTEKAARLLAINPGDYATAEDTVCGEVDAIALGAGYGAQTTVRLYDADTWSQIAPADLAAAPFGYRFLVGAELTWQPRVPFMTLSDTFIAAAHHGVVDRIP